jgi:hypothetical protein
MARRETTAFLAAVAIATVVWWGGCLDVCDYNCSRQHDECIDECDRGKSKDISCKDICNYEYDKCADSCGNDTTGHDG